jgi:hypothetical protein
MTWQPLGAVEPKQLVAARIELHWALQVLAAAVAEYVPRAPGDAHTSLTLDAGVWRARTLRSGQRLAFVPLEFAVEVSAASGDTQRVSLAGLTLHEGLLAVSRAIAPSDPPKLSIPSYDMPESSVTSGRAFERPNQAHLAELGRWFSNGFELLTDWLGDKQGATEVALWPHHFDVGGIWMLDSGKPAEQAPQIGVGLSPGDGTYAEPYFYVTPWPLRSDVTVPALPSGAHWQQDAFMGAILPATDLLTMRSAEHAVREYLEAAVTAGKRLVSLA